MININGPPIDYWPAKKYVLSWLKSGHKSALDKPTRLKAVKVEPPLGSASRLFSVFCQ